MVTHDARSRLFRSRNARARVARTRYEPQPGDIVRVWRSRDRKNKKEPGYIGPCIVILCEGSSVWISRRGELWKCDIAQIQQCSRKETLSTQVVSQLVLQARERLKYDPEKLGFQDVSREGFPDHDQEGEDLEAEAVVGAPRDDVDMGTDGGPPASSPAPEPVSASAIPASSSGQTPAQERVVRKILGLGQIPVQGRDSIAAGPQPEVIEAAPEPPRVDEPGEQPSPALPTATTSEEDIAEDVDVSPPSSTPSLPRAHAPVEAQAAPASTPTVPAEAAAGQRQPSAAEPVRELRRLDFDVQDPESRAQEPPKSLGGLT